MNAELLSYFGNDNMIVNAARVSYNKDASNYTNEKNEKLITYLVEQKHTAPFRHPVLQFRITCPIYVERQLFKHQVGLSANSISGRYVDFSDSYEKIQEWRKQSKVSKQGSDEALSESLQKYCSNRELEVIKLCKEVYNEFIKIGVSKEQARTILPLNLNTTFIWTGSLLAYIHLWQLRLKNDTQSETRQVAYQMLQHIKSIEGNPFEFTLKAFKL